MGSVHESAPQSLPHVIWLHGFCARRLPHSLCCMSSRLPYTLLPRHRDFHRPQLTPEVVVWRACQQHVLSCHAAAGLSLRRVFFLRTSSVRGSGLAKANVRERTQTVGGLSGWLCSQGTSRRCDPPRSARAVREAFAVVCQFKRRGRPRAGNQWRNTSLVLCGSAAPPRSPFLYT